MLVLNLAFFNNIRFGTTIVLACITIVNFKDGDY